MNKLNRQLIKKFKVLIFKKIKSKKNHMTTLTKIVYYI